MAKALPELENPLLHDRPPYRSPEPVYPVCACGCGHIDCNDHAFIESKVTGKLYCDIVGMAQAEGCTWEGERIRDEWGTLYSLDQFKRVMEVVSHG